MNYEQAYERGEAVRLTARTPPAPGIELTPMREDSEALDEIVLRGPTTIHIQRSGKHSYTLRVGDAEFEFTGPDGRGPGLFLTSNWTDR